MKIRCIQHSLFTDHDGMEVKRGAQVLPNCDIDGAGIPVYGILIDKN